jgi:hypothetical protein
LPCAGREQGARRPAAWSRAMSTNWEDYQIRLGPAEDLAKIAHDDPGNAALQPLREILARHNAALQNQFDAFAAYVAEAEQQGLQEFPLYRWTKAVIEDPAKKAKHLKIFTLYVGGEEVYPRAVAEALEADLLPLVGRGVIENLSKYDTNPQNNPQAPAHLR